MDSQPAGEELGEDLGEDLTRLQAGPFVGTVTIKSDQMRKTPGWWFGAFFPYIGNNDPD